MTRGGGVRASASSTAARCARPGSRRTPRARSRAMSAGRIWRLTGRLHCTLWAAEWPRIDVRALFLQPLLMDSQTTRTVAMCMELVGPSRAIRQAERAATETATEQSLRARVGQRTSQRQSQRDRAAQSASGSSPKATPPSATPPT